FFFQAEDGIRVFHVTGVQTCALPIYTLDINQSYHWTLYQEKENIYAPLINDRGFSFTKTDGLLFGILLKSLGIENIDNYYQKKRSEERRVGKAGRKQKAQ